MNSHVILHSTGMTALHGASVRGHPGVVELLLQHGALKEARTKYGELTLTHTTLNTQQLTIHNYNVYWTSYTHTHILTYTQQNIKFR